MSDAMTSACITTRSSSCSRDVRPTVSFFDDPRHTCVTSLPLLTCVTSSHTWVTSYHSSTILGPVEWHHCHCPPAWRHRAPAWRHIVVLRRSSCSRRHHAPAQSVPGRQQLDGGRRQRARSKQRGGRRQGHSDETASIAAAGCLDVNRATHLVVHHHRHCRHSTERFVLT